MGIAKAYSPKQARVIAFISMCGKYKPEIKKRLWKDVYSKLKVKSLM